MDRYKFFPSEKISASSLAVLTASSAFDYKRLEGRR